MIQESAIILPPEKRIINVKKLEDALASQDPKEIARILNSPEGKKLLPTLVIDRGESDANLKLLRKIFDFLVQNKFGEGKTIFDVKDGKKIIEMIHESNLPEEFLRDLVDATFHQFSNIDHEERRFFFHLVGIIIENKEMFENQEVPLSVGHAAASWFDSRDNNPEKAGRKNSELIVEAKKINNIFFEAKMMVGKASQKGKRGLPPSKQLQDYQKASKMLVNTPFEHYAYRAKIEEIKALIEIARSQNNKSQRGLRMKNLENALELAHESLNYAPKVSFDNLETLALKALFLVYKEMKNTAGMAETKKAIDDNSKKNLYKTNFPESL